MDRMKLWLLLILLLVPMTQASATVTPVCQQSSVIQEMRRTIRAGDYYDRLDSRLITEMQLPDPHYVRCDVCVAEVEIRDRTMTIHQIRQCHRLRSFSVQILPRGFVVAPLR
jgi:hypothetical protein